ncbi:MAG: hypothetical protein Q9M36_03010 [Sulfurovum sp.]|nr:hypothetical protein [Sulfurovum sp.]
MFKYLSFFLFFSLFLSADYLNTLDRNRCVYNVQPNQNRQGICYTITLNNRDLCDVNLQYSDLIDGYEQVGGGCFLKNDLQLTGFTQIEYSYFLALIAHVLGLTMLILISYLSIQIARS